MAAAISLAACATRRPEMMIPEAPRSIIPVWKLETGDQITTKIYREPDLASQTTVSQAGEAYFPGLGRVKVAGLTMDSLQLELTNRYDKLVIDAAVDAVMMRDVVIYGQVRSPGVYNVDPALTVLGPCREGRRRDGHRQVGAAHPREGGWPPVPPDARSPAFLARHRPW